MKFASQQIEQVVFELITDRPFNERISKFNDLRFGSRGSLSIHPDKGTYYDHETGEGGGLVGLLKREKGHSGPEAVQWLADRGINISER
jgi:hypothetical protein